MAELDARDEGVAAGVSELHQPFLPLLAYPCDRTSFPIKDFPDCAPCSFACPLLDECQQIGIDEVGMRGEQAVRQTRIGLQRTVRQ